MTKLITLVFFILGISFSAFSRNGKDTQPTIINGIATIVDSKAHEQMLLSSVNIYKVETNGGVPNFDRKMSGCSGTLTANNSISTATHCFTGTKSTWGYYAEVRTSIHPDVRKFIRIDTVKTEKPIEETMGITSRDPKKRGLDFATATLAEDVDVKNVATYCKDGDIKVNSSYEVSGFGVTETGEKSKDLRHTQVLMQQMNEGTFFSKPIREQKPESAACYADSGGGLWITAKDGKSACLAGTVSGNDQPAKDDTPVNLCLRKNLRQIFARANAAAVKRHTVITDMKPLGKAPVLEPMPGFEGTLGNDPDPDGDGFAEDGAPVKP